jgi:hypothetical protein
MRNNFFIILLLIFSACQSTKIKNARYLVSTSNPEIGSIGQSKSLFDLRNDFEVRTFPKLENNIRIAIDIIPYNKKLNDFYKAKAKFNQNQSKIAYTDSLASKPELVTIRLMDVSGFINELNATYNSDVFRLLIDTQNSKIVSSLAANLSTDEIAKIRQADTYYLTNQQNNKYILALYTLGKKTATIDINTNTIVAYQLSSFCWATSERGNWYIADIVKNSKSCKGKTKARINEKKRSKNLFDL